jgi:hypothetical protein
MTSSSCTACSSRRPSATSTPVRLPCTLAQEEPVLAVALFRQVTGIQLRLEVETEGFQRFPATVALEAVKPLAL